MPKPLKVLFVQHYFPPGEGGRVQKIIRYIQEFGIEPIMLSACMPSTPNEYREFTTNSGVKSFNVPLRGPTYFATRFYSRGPTSRHYSLLKLLSLPERIVYVPDHMVRWVGNGKKLAREIVSREGIDAVFTSSPSESTHLVGMALKEEFGTSWVADFRDMWTGKSSAYRPATPLHDRRIRRIERKVMHSADHIVANTPENRDTYVHDFDLEYDKISVIPNGFDPSDLEVKSKRRFESRRFRIGYMGALTKGAFPWRVFLEALDKLANDVGRQNVEFVYCGRHNSEVDDFVQRNGIEDLFSYFGMMPHADAMQLMSETNAQLVLLYENVDSHTIVPQKLYNYLILNGPILAISPEQGAVARVLEETSSGTVVAGSRGLNSVYKKLRELYDAWERGEKWPPPDPDVLANYNRRNHSQQIAEIFRTLSS